MEKLPAGLTSEEAKKRLLEFGPNTLHEEPPKSALLLAASQLQSPLIVILLVASLITFFLGDTTDTVVILLAVFVNTILGFIQEYKADRALFGLKKLLVPVADVVRDANVMHLSVKDIVPGDIVIVSAGDRIPADGEIVSSVKLFVNEAMLTGESVAVEKKTGQVFMGTVVVSGRGAFRVTATGTQTKMGNLAVQLSQTEEEQTPLQKQLSGLSRFLVAVVLVISALVFLLGVLSGIDVKTMFSTSVAVAVASIPEGMVVALTVVLAIGMQRIYRRNAIVRRLSAAETLGAVTVVCVDKTGTITQGIMSVVKTHFRDRELALQAAVYANNLDDPLEVALWDFVKDQNGYDPARMTDFVKRVDELPFDAERRYMAAITTSGLWVKGAPDVLLSKSNVSSEEKQNWERRIEEFAKEGLRVLALCYKHVQGNTVKSQDIESLTFAGIVGLADPVREGVGAAIQTLRTAGITVVMVTGDYSHTARAVLEKIGLPIHDPGKEVMEGEELEKMDRETLIRRVSDVRLFCRVTPQQKFKIVSALQNIGHVVAMTGDGVNDALALKKAEIGLVVASASDVARETADIVLLDSNIRTIAAIVEEGRGIYHAMRKVVVYLLTGAFSEVVAIAAAIVAGIPIPLTAAQILWINLITDGLPSIALTVDPKDRHLMRERPRAREANLVSRNLIGFILVVSFGIGLLTMALFAVALNVSQDLVYSRTLAFLVLGTSSLVIGFSVRNLHAHIWQEGFWKNPWLLGSVILGMGLQIIVVSVPRAQKFFHTTPVGGVEFAIAVGSGIVTLLGIELLKLVRHTIKP